MKEICGASAKRRPANLEWGLTMSSLYIVDVIIWLIAHIGVPITALIVTIFFVTMLVRAVTWPFRKAWSLLKPIFLFLRSFLATPDEDAPVTKIFEYGAIDRVIDGDTVVFSGRRVRILHIDAPELGQGLTGKDLIDAGEAARDMMQLYCVRREARLRIEGTDTYGRLLARVYITGEDLGLKLVRAGYAIALDDAPDDYKQAHQEAKKANRGLWGMGGFETPAAWRRAHTKAA